MPYAAKTLIIMLKLILIVVCAVLPVYGLDNGLALTPPMGWMSWERFRCVTDCEQYPDECISEKLFKEIADRMAADGYRDAGYEYLIIDDCWLSKQRDENGKLQPDPVRFPSGIKALADYVHSKGLKFGIYEDYGTYTCAGYPGIYGHLAEDAQTFAEWEVDYIKVDGCYADIKTMELGYIEFGQHLNKTGRPIVYSCSWPAYQEGAGVYSNYSLLADTCNLWRNYGDIDDSWNAVANILDFYTRNQDRFGPFSGPGHWNDPDMLIIGNYGLSLEQSKAQMALWAILASPLLMSVDLRTIKPDQAAVLQHQGVIAINQDPLGKQGRLISKDNNIEIFTKPITPVIEDNYSYAIAVLSRRTDGTPYPVTINFKALGLNNPTGYTIENVYDGGDPIVVLPNTNLKVHVNPTGIVLLRATVIKQ